MSMPSTQLRIRRRRRLAISCSLVSLAVAMFWLTEMVRGEIPSTLKAFLTIIYFSVISIMFVHGARGNAIPLAEFVALPFISLWFVWDAESQHAVALAGTITVVFSVGLIFAAYLLERSRRRDPPADIEPT